MSLRRRLEHLEKRSRPAPRSPSPTELEAWALDEEIRLLEREIGEAEATMSLEEIVRTEAEDRAFMESIEHLPLDEEIAALEAAIKAEE